MLRFGNDVDKALLPPPAPLLTCLRVSPRCSALPLCLWLPPLFPSLSTPQSAGWPGAHTQVSDQPAGAQPRPHRRLQVGLGHVRWHQEQLWTPSPTLRGGDGSSSPCRLPLNCSQPQTDAKSQNVKMHKENFLSFRRGCV